MLLVNVSSEIDDKKMINKVWVSVFSEKVDYPTSFFNYLYLDTLVILFCVVGLFSKRINQTCLILF